MVSQIYFLKCLQISSTQIKHTYNYSAAVNKLLVIWNYIFYLTHTHTHTHKTERKKERNGKKEKKSKRKKRKSPLVDPCGYRIKYKASPLEHSLEFCGSSMPSAWNVGSRNTEAARASLTEGWGARPVSLREVGLPPASRRLFLRSLRPGGLLLL